MMAQWRGWLAAAALLAASGANAQGTKQEAREAGAATQDAARETGEAARSAAPVAAPSADARPLADRCEALIRGEVAGDTDLQSRCASLLRSATSGGAQAEPGVARGEPAAGRSVAAAFTSAGRELFGQGERQPLGMRAGGPSTNLLTTNPIGWFTGLGVNATYSRSLDTFDKLSWIGQARYARANSSNGNVTTFGLGAGADFFLFGRDNEGLRVGPRLSASFGTEDTGRTTSFARLGLSGEIGYNFVANNGLAASVAGGVGGRIAGDAQNEDFASFTGGEFGPYLQLGLGYGW